MDEGYDRRKLVAIGVGVLVVVLVVVFLAVRHSAGNASAGPTVVTATQTVNPIPTDTGTDAASTPAPTQGSSIVDTRTSLPPVTPTAGWKQTETFSVPPSYSGAALNTTAAAEVARRFALAFSTYTIGAPQSTWVSSLASTSSGTLSKALPGRFDEFWYYLTSSGAGASDARVTQTKELWQKGGTALYRVTVTRRTVAPSNAGMNGTETVQWDIQVGAQSSGGPKVVAVEKAAAGPLPSP